MVEDEVYERTAELFATLASPRRLALVERLAQAPAAVGELAEDLGVPQPLVSQHLRVLRQARLVRGRRDGRTVTYEVVDEHVAHVVADALEHEREHDARPQEHDPDGG
ncbi:helix-turn-helix transcriptional regulator [uncultured Pseudokineococcus sp.]|uniref:ArsR/SmtB family transcription factor n=1 Tax=uncultured Pseudokineococcus sp. TaxID=1642928 RepID=UPI00260B2D9B|nr:metalloregulator ArsR/SmtB family transcription factor [uncultured Pseudokineococcus sp.]